MGKKTVYISPMVIELLKNTAKKDNNPYVITGQIEGRQPASCYSDLFVEAWA